VEHCPGCGYMYAAHAVSGIAAELATLGPRYASRLHTLARTPDGEKALRRRPEPDVWSALEYACHVRDVMLAQRERLFLAVIEDCPSFAPIYPDRRTALANYATELGPAPASEPPIGLDPASTTIPAEPDEASPGWPSTPCTKGNITCWTSTALRSCANRATSRN